jgi:hypothetical protein
MSIRYGDIATYIHNQAIKQMTLDLDREFLASLLDQLDEACHSKKETQLQGILLNDSLSRMTELTWEELNDILFYAKEVLKNVNQNHRYST